MFHKIARRCLAVALGITLAAGACVTARAQGKSLYPVVIGGRVRVNLRVGDTLNGRAVTPEERVQTIDEVFAKHLGGKKGKVTAKKVGDRVHLYLNGDFILAATPADAKAGGYKKVDEVAAAWQKSLQKAFDEGKGTK
jgi:hypothetical protein